MSHLTSHVYVANNIHMKKILVLLIALSACGDDMAYAPDAAPRAEDAAVDTPAPDAPAQRGGCMGNLPNSRTITINTGDPIPANLVNEIQDNIIAGNFATRQPRIFPGAWSLSTPPGTAAECVLAPGPLGSLRPAWKIGDGETYATQIPYDVGDRVTAFSMYVYGDGVVDWQADLWWHPDLNSASGSVQVATASGTNTAATWANVAFGSVNPTLLTGAGSLSMTIVFSSGAGVFLHVGYLTPTFDRLP